MTKTIAATRAQTCPTLSEAVVYCLRGGILIIRIFNCFLVDQCTPTSGCGIHESCIPSGPNGFARCICKNGYERQNGQCKIKPPSTSTLVTSLPVKTASKAGGKDRGGDGNVVRKP